MRLKKLLKFGTIEELDEKTCRATVHFSDDDTTSDWLVILQKGSHKTREKDLPNEGEKVACLMDENLEDGCIVGSYYSDDETPPSEANSIVKEVVDAFKTVIDKLAGALVWTFKKITFTADEMSLNAAKININGVDLITWANTHVHGNGNNGSNTTATTQEIPKK